MSNEISKISTASTAPNQMLEQFQELAGDSTKAKEVIGKALEVLAGVNVKVTRADSTGVDGASEKKTTGATSTPALDNPADTKQVEANLEKLIAFLQLDNEKRQTEMAKERIEMQKSTLETEHKSRMAEISKTLEKMDDAQKASLANRIFGWLGAIIAVVAAVAVFAVTGGAAAGFAIAGAALAVGSLVMNETGAMEALTKKFSEHMQEKYGWSKSKADLFASLTINLSIMALQLGCAGAAAYNAFHAGAQAVTAATSVTAKTVQNVATFGSLGIGVGAMTAGAVSTGLGFKAQSAQADVSELEKFMQQLQQNLDECQEELEQLLQYIQAGTGKIAEILTSATDTSSEIARKIGAMA